MSEEVIAALISAVVTVVCTVITVYYGARKSDNAPSPPRPEEKPPEEVVPPPNPPVKWRFSFGLVLLILAIFAAGIAVPIVLAKTGLVGDNSPSLEDRIRNEVTVRSSRGGVWSVERGKTYYAFSIWITGPSDLLDSVKKVRYEFDPKWFQKATIEVTKSTGGFKAVYPAYGAVTKDMDVVLVMTDGNRVTLKHNVHKAVFGK